MRSLFRSFLLDQFDSACLYPRVPPAVCVGRRGAAPPFSVVAAAGRLRLSGVASARRVALSLVRRCWSSRARSGAWTGGALLAPAGETRPLAGGWQDSVPARQPPAPQPLVLSWCMCEGSGEQGASGAGEPRRGRVCGQPLGRPALRWSQWWRSRAGLPLGRNGHPATSTHAQRHFDETLTHGLEKDAELLPSVYFALKILSKRGSRPCRIHDTCS